MPEMFVMGSSITYFVLPIIIISVILILGSMVVLIKNYRFALDLKIYNIILMLICLTDIFLAANFCFWWIQIIVPSDWFYYYFK